MVWFKVDDDLAFHAKALRAGNAAMGVWVRAGSECGHQLTDGFVTRELALAIGRPADIRRLVDAGLWEPAEVDGQKGWRFHEFLQRNPSREEVEQKRKEEADRKAAWRAKRAADRAAGDAGPTPDDDGTDEVVPAGVPVGQPPDETRDSDVSPVGVPLFPTRPDPVSPNGDTPSLRSGAAQKRGTRLPDDFAPDEHLRKWARQRGFTDPQIDEVTASFVRYWRAKSGRDATKLDWRLTWQNWVAKEDPGRVRVLAVLPNGDLGMTAQQIDDLLGVDSWQPPAPPPEVDSDDWPAYQAWLRRVRDEHRAERVRLARAELERRVPT